MQPTTDLPFKFRFVQDGQARGLRAKAASASSDALVMDGEPIRYEDIVHTTSQDKRLVLALASTVQLGQKTAKACQEGGVLALEVQGVQARDLERTIDRRASALAAQRHKRELAAAGEESRYRVMTCRHCGATIDLSGFERTRYVYCRYCQSILDQGGSLHVGKLLRTRRPQEGGRQGPGRPEPSPRIVCAGFGSAGHFRSLGFQRGQQYEQ